MKAKLNIRESVHCHDASVPSQECQRINILTASDEEIISFIQSLKPEELGAQLFHALRTLRGFQTEYEAAIDTFFEKVNKGIQALKEENGK